MNSCLLISLLLMATLLPMYYGQLNSVSIKSYEVLTKGISHHEVSSIYDNNADTIGSFYSSTSRTVETEFDLGKNYLIDHILIRMKKETNIHKINISVGNSFNGYGVMPYVCERPNESEELYKCQPSCRSADTTQPGIIARKFVVQLLIPSIWVSVYDMQVFSKPILVSDDISSNRLISPYSCDTQSWLLSDNTQSINITKLVGVTTVPTNIYFEKPYIITKINVKFNNTAPGKLDIVMINDKNKTIASSLILSDCSLQKSLYTCSLQGRTFSTKQLQINTIGLTRIFISGKPVFYPKLDIKTVINVKEKKLQMTCEYSQCDLSVHSDCADETIKTGVKFECVNKRLIRMPSGSDLDSYVIVNQGKVDPVWQSTKFSANIDLDGNMIVSMPRSYQYFGQYKCACIVADKMNTEITSGSTDFKETNFLEDVVFDTRVQYKLSDSEDALFHNVTNNVIYLPKSGMDATFIPMKITMLSLLTGNTIVVTYPNNDNGFETSSIDRSTSSFIKAFDNIPQSWSVAANKYVVDEIFPERIHGKDITINCNSSISNLRQKQYIKLLDEDKVKIKPAMWSIDYDAKKIQINTMYASTEEAKLLYKEKTCMDSKTIVLATFTNDKVTALDSRLSSSKLNNSVLLSFVDETNFGRDIVLDIVATKNNGSVEKFLMKENVTLEQDDVVVKPRYTGLTSSVTNSSINVVEVEVDVISKKINDFISCGGVMVNIQIPGRDQQKMILQNSKFVINVAMTSSTINITVIISIEGIQGIHVANLKITDPTQFKAYNVELQDDHILNLLWNGVDEIARDFLQSYELKTETTTVACNTTTVQIKSIPKSQTSGAKNRYQIPMNTVSAKHLVNLSVSVQPVFIGNKRGQVTRVQRQFNTIAASAISIADAILPTERAITITASQSELSCDVMDVEFNVTGINVEKVQWKAVKLGDLSYKITNLTAGRNYKLSAKVIYKFGPQDTLSKSYAFETADDISILKTKHVAKMNEHVNISCTVDIGPDDKFRKTVEWLRADKSALPDGVKSVVSTLNSNTAFLIMENALADHSGEYGCFARPAASTGSMKITIVVNDLLVSNTEQKVDFSKPTGNVSVTCSSSTVSQNNLMWTDPLGSTIPETGSKKYSIKKMVTDQNVYKSTLTIMDVSLNTSGVYKCHKTIGNMKAVKEFLLYGDEKINIEVLPNSSFVIGEILKLRCRAQAGISDQKAVWEIITANDNSTKLMTTSYPFPSVQTTEDVEIVNSLSIHQVSCILSPILKKSLMVTYRIKLQSKIVVHGPSEVKTGTDVSLTCVGYPNSNNMQLEWKFFPMKQNTTTSGKVVVTSDKQPIPKSYDPIKLNLNLTNVQSAEEGRYECKFKQEVKGGGLLLGKSINLLIKGAAIKPAVQDNNNNRINNTKKSAHHNGPITVLFTVLVLVSLSMYGSRS